MDVRPKTLILGLGNPLRGDDGVGPRIVEELSGRQLPQGVQVLDGGNGGLDLLRVLEGWRRVVVVDAAEVGQDPGEFVRFTPEEVRLAEAPNSLSLHNAGLGEALALAEALEQRMPEIVIFGVQPERVGWGGELSSAVEAALPALADAILEEVSRVC